MASTETRAVQRQTGAWRPIVESVVVWIGRAAVVVVPLVLWQVAADRGVIDTFAYSKPTDIWSQIVTWIDDGTIAETSG